MTAFAADTPRSPAGTPLVKIALSRAKKSGAPLDTLATTTGRKVAVGLRPNAHNTGSWTYNRARRGGPRHEVTLDPNAHLSVTVPVPARGTANWWLEYFAAIIRHEVHHGLHTERNLVAVHKGCVEHAVPFISLNIAEDIRIDTIARKSHGEYRWDRYYQPDAKQADIKEPLEWLVYYKLCEGVWSRFSHRIVWRGVDRAERVRLGKPDGKGKRPAGNVLQEFADEFAAASDTLALLPLLRDLFLTFPTAERDAGKISGLPSGIVGHGYSGTDPKHRTPSHVDDAVEIVDHTQISTPANLPPHLPADVRYFLGDAKEKAYSGYGDIMQDDESFRDKTGRSTKGIAKKSRELAARLAALMGQVGGQPTRLSSSGSRLHVRGVMVGDSQSFRVTGRRKGERPNVVVLFDQSGSMSSDWGRHGAAFLGAFLMLDQQGKLDVTAVLTGGHKHAIVPRNFPAESVARFICGEGCESVDKTLKAVKAAVTKADVVLIYTDGALTDGEVRAGEWRKHGVDLIGVAVAAEGYDTEGKRRALTHHFARAIIAEDGEKLATKIIQYIASR